MGCMGYFFCLELVENDGIFARFKLSLFKALE